MKSKLAVFVSMLVASVAVGAEEPLHVHAGSNPAAIPFVNKGVELLDRGDDAAARRSFDEAIRLDPSMWPAYANRARLFAKQHQWQAALRDLNETIRQKPNFLIGAVMRASVNQYLGNYRASLDEINHVLTFYPISGKTASMALDQRAWLEAACPDSSFRNGPKAVADAKRACELDRWKSGTSLDTLAAAYAETGDFDAAIRYEQKALALAQLDPNAWELRKEGPGHLAHFQKHQPIREPAR